MSIPNTATLYQQIAKGSEGGNEFARFVRLLLISEHKLLGNEFVAESDASGDYKKVDAYIPGDREFPILVKAFQFKFFPSSLSSKQKNEIIKSVKAALKENEFIQEFILVTPEDWHKEQQKWFDDLKIKFEKTYWISNSDISRKCHFKLIHWGHSKIVELSLKHDHVGCKYFPELFPYGIGKFKLAKATVDTKVSAWRPSGYSSFSFYLDSWQSTLATEPVFDFQFKNSTQEIHLLEKIEIHIEEIWTKLKGLPQEELLQSIGTIQIPMNFSKSINEYLFEDPLVLQSGKAKRFKVQLNDFKKCPGNCIRLKFWFYFDEITIPSSTFTLSL